MVWLLAGITGVAIGGLTTWWYLRVRKEAVGPALEKGALGTRWLEHSRQLVLVSDEHGVILTASPTVEKVLLSLGKRVGRSTFLNLFSKADRDWWRSRVTPETFSSDARVMQVDVPGDTRHAVLVQVDSLDKRRRLVHLIDLKPYTRLAEHHLQLLEVDSLALAQMPYGVLVVRSGLVRFVNPAFRRMFSLEAAAVEGKEWNHIFHQQALDALLKVNKAAKPAKSQQHELELARSSGKKFWCQVHWCALPGSGEGENFLAYFRDASDQRAFARHLQQAAVVFASSSDAISIIDQHKRVKLVNNAFCSMTGFRNEEIIGRNAMLLGAEQKDIKQLEKIWAIVESKGAWQGEVWKRRRDGSRYPEWMSVTAVRSKSGEVTEYVVIANDMTERKQAEDRIRYQANFDPLTDLPNRNLFMDRLRQGIERAKRDRTLLAVLFIDLDRFKYINDSFGHGVGDLLLVKVAEILKGCVRTSDTIARFGGDEFAIILSPVYGARNAGRVAANILERLSRPIDLDGYEAVTGGSIGVSLFPTDGGDAETLVKNADSAMYRAKERGRNTYQFYTEEMQQNAQRRILMERDLRAALADESLDLVFQPQLSCKTGSVGGMEVLMRWANGEHGLIPPSVFISLAEDTGLIVPMGRWILLEACEQYMSWHREGIAPPQLAVNVSPRQFKDKSFVTMVSDVIAETGISPFALELEITESMLMEDHEFALSVLQQLRSLGLKLSIDDFGTGYSSLAYLREFPMDTVKIDQSFIKHVDSKEDDAAIVRAIVNLGHTLNMKVVAEGVETEEQLALLKEFGVDYIQGYYFAKPMSAKLCKTFLQSRVQRGGFLSENQPINQPDTPGS
jgi:diguanylate cyclase (GGDEF)-like protein/PAS domain S-box-containing protein